MGDIIARAPLEGSLDVLDFLSSHNVTGVRGNHDQKVIEWYGWINWITSLHGGQRWLNRLEERWSDATELDSHIDLKLWLEKERKADKSKEWWNLIPKGWVPLGDHYRIAKGMSGEQFRYLLQLPLRLYIPHVHAFIVHAGLLPADPRYPLDDKRQPLARIPKAKDHELDVEKLRQLQELSLISQVPQNADPWVILNMRSVLDGEVRKGKKGIFWTKIWREQMDRCGGFNMDDFALNRDLEGATKHSKLPCYPISTIYGHTASKGLDIHRWTFGLDSGCVSEFDYDYVLVLRIPFQAYKRTLSALIIGGEDPGAGETDMDDSEEDNIEERSTSRKRSSFKFSDNLEARVVSVGC